MPAIKTNEKRSIIRLPCVIAVNDPKKAASLGNITDISLDGFFVATKDPLPTGSVVPLAFLLGTTGAEIRPMAEVVRSGKDGMGLRITSISKQDQRRLRRYVTELANLVGNRAAAKASLSNDGQYKTVPFSDPAKIRNLLVEAAGASAFTIIPNSDALKDKASLVAVDPDGLKMRLHGASELKQDESVFVLYTVSYVSYSFESRVIGRDGTAITLSVPASLSYSERRMQDRAPLAGTFVSLVLPWRGPDVLKWPILERSATGLSFRAEAKEVYFWPGIDLPEVTIHNGDREEKITGAQVRHLTAVTDTEHWVKVGVAFASHSVGQVDVASDTLLSSVATPTPVKWGRDLMARVAYLYHRTVRKVGDRTSADALRVVKFNNVAGQQLVGLLNIAFPEHAGKKMPTIIITPGFGARKETMAGLAATIIENFRRNERNVAVLRYDGTNSLGESHKSPGCEAEGKEHIKYTVSDGINDVLGAMKWVQSNKTFEATDVVIVSVSFSSVAVRRALTLPEMNGVKLWVSFMGAPDAQNAIMNVAGNVDGYGHFLQGIKVGVVALLGCLIDSDHFCADMQRLQVANLDDAKRDMAQIKADVVWFVGKHDAFMDGKRVQAIMQVAASGARKIVEVEAGHVPQSSHEALAEFVLMTRHIWKTLFKQDIDALPPSQGKLASTMQDEWARVRRGVPVDQKNYWEQYLLGGTTGVGFDIWNLTPAYAQLIVDTAAAGPIAGNDVLEVGAGTGNLTVKALAMHPKSYTALDIVPAALSLLQEKTKGDAPLAVVTGSADGSARVAIRRWLGGDLASFAALVRRLPAAVQGKLAPVVDTYDDDIHAYLRGHDVGLEALTEKGQFDTDTKRALQDLRTSVSLVRGEMTHAEAKKVVSAPFYEVVDSHGGLPFPNASFDTVLSSLVLSYMSHVGDALFEVRRVLRSGGTFVASTLLPDADQSKIFLQAIKEYEIMPESKLPEGLERQTILTALREFVDRGANLLRLEEEGAFHFWSASDFAGLMQRAGFADVNLTLSFGVPPQGAIVRCRNR